jgi:hypothetical protein
VTPAVPGTVGSGEDLLRVERAWPGRRDDGSARVVVEGSDPTGRVRAAELTLGRTGRGWTPTRLRVAPYGRDDRLPGLAAVAADGTVVVHRHGRRAVVRRPDRFVKVVRPGRAAEVAARAELGRRTATTAGMSAPAVLAVSDDRVDFGVLPGRSLHELGREASLRQWCTWWSAWAERWPGLARSAGRDDAGLPTHTAEDECATLRAWVDRAVGFGLLPRPALEERLERVAAALTESGPDPRVTAHRDLHDKQLLADGTDLGLLDFDTVSSAEPALDLANLAVHARLRVAQGWWPADRAATVLAAVDRAAGELDVDPARLAAYAGATRLRLACVYAFRPRWAALARGWAVEPDENSLTRLSSPAQIGGGRWGP